MAREPPSTVDKRIDERTSGSGSRRRRGAAIRHAALDADRSNDKGDWVVGDKEAIADTTGVDEKLALQDKVASFIETVEFQAALVALIAFDLCSTASSLLLRAHYEISHLQALIAKNTSATTNSNGRSVDVDATVIAAPRLPAIISIVLRLLDSLAGFTVVIFVLELAILGYVFRQKFLSHFGYVVDVLVVAMSIGLEIYTESSAPRLLGVLRMWRLFRLGTTLIGIEQSEHEITLEALEAERSRVFQLQFEKQAAEDSLKKEFESRAGIERMLQGYKDEADTLREALTIAAQAVAEATLGQLSGEAEADEATMAASLLMSGESRVDYNTLNTLEPNPTEQRTRQNWETQSDERLVDDEVAKQGGLADDHVDWKTSGSEVFQSQGSRIHDSGILGLFQAQADDEGEFVDAPTE